MNNNQPYQTYVDRGFFRVLEQKFDKPNGETCINIKTLVYQAGVEFIRRQLQQDEWRVGLLLKCKPRDPAFLRRFREKHKC